MMSSEYNWAAWYEFVSPPNKVYNNINISNQQGDSFRVANQCLIEIIFREIRSRNIYIILRHIAHLVIIKQPERSPIICPSHIQ